jgi:hypothetical protein
MTNTRTPAVGMDATIQVGSDRYAATVVVVANNGRTVTAAHQGSGRTSTFTLRHNGRFVLKGAELRANMTLALGVAKTELDPSF